MGVMSAVDLIEAWSDLLRRRPTFAPALAVYEELVRLWAGAPVEGTPLDRDSGGCAHRWARGVRAWGGAWRADPGRSHATTRRRDRRATAGSGSRHRRRPPW